MHVKNSVDWEQEALVHYVVLLIKMVMKNFYIFLHAPLD